MKANPLEVSAFVLYMLVMIGIGVFFFLRSKGGASEYFLGGRKLGSWVTALSAQASDMSGWLLMGLPGSLLALGMGEIWIAVGLLIGTYLNWLFVAKRLRRYTECAKDSITLPEFLQNRFLSQSLVLRVICAVIFFVCFTLYTASALKACGTLFQSLLGLDYTWALTIGALIVISYTFLGGFLAVSFTDLIQSLLMLAALLVVPLLALNAIGPVTAASFSGVDPAQYLSLVPRDNAVTTILSGLAWGLGYFGMPHIIVRFMAIKSDKMIKKSRIIAVVWVILALGAAVAVGLLGRVYLPTVLGEGFESFAANNSEQVFIEMIRHLTPAFVTGLLFSGVLAAAMSTADSQLLVAASAVTNDVYKPVFRKKAGDKELMWVGRVVVLLIAVIAYFIALSPNTGSIMDLVSNAWAGFGASFGPAILLSLYWKRTTYRGVVTGILAGGVTVILWILLLSKPTGIYELLPGFLVGFAGVLIGSLADRKPSAEVVELFDRAVGIPADRDAGKSASNRAGDESAGG